MNQRITIAIAISISIAIAITTTITLTFAIAFTITFNTTAAYTGLSDKLWASNLRSSPPTQIHPNGLIVVTKSALNWMGVPVSPFFILDILARNSQAASIYQSFVRTGEWLVVNQSGMPTFADGGHEPEYRAVQRLKRFDGKWYIRLRTEESYLISVDTEKIQVPHVNNANSVLVEPEFHHNPLDRNVKPDLLTDKNIKFAWDPPISFPVFIPTIPGYIDSCLAIL